MAVTGESEVSKLQKHLSLLRQEYTKLQTKFTETEQKLALASAVSGDLSQDNLVSQLLRTAADLYEKESYSDVTVKYGHQKRKAHKLILAARSSRWTDKELNDVDEIELTGLGTEVGNTIMKWVYTDKVDIKKDETFIINLVHAATKYDLNPLKTRCERLLMSSITVSNCIRFYQTAEDIGASGLKKYCTEIIANHWDDFKTEDFRDISASLLYDMFKAKSQYPLHMAIRHHREDIVFLYLIEFNTELPGKLNEMDVSTQELPLQIALKEKQDSIAKTLINHNCDINAVDHEGNSLLHRAITEGDEFAATFLIENEANVRARTEKSRSTPLHLAAAYQAWSFERGKMQSATKASAQGMARIAKLLLDHEADPNTADIEGRSPMHLALLNGNEPVFEVLLEHPSLDLEAKDDNGHVLLWFAIMASKGNILDDEEERSYAARLVKKGSSADAVNPLTGDSLLHMAAFGGNEAAGLFLARYGAQRNHCNKKGESPLHAAAEKGLTALVTELLKSGANPNSQTIPTDKLRAQAEQRQLERQRLRKENRHRIISLEKAKAMKKLKELQEAKEKRHSQQAEQPSNDTNPGALRLNPFEYSSSRSNTMSSIVYPNNPFLTSPTEEINPFLASDSFGNEESDYLAGLEVATAAAMSLTSDSQCKPQYFVDNKGTSKPYRPSLTSYDGRLDLNAVTSPTEIETFDFDNMEINDLDLEGELEHSIITECWDKTPVHMAVAAGKAEVVKCFIDFKENSSHGGGGGRILIAPDFNLRDSEGQTPLELALWTNQVAIAQSLVFAEAEVNAVSADGDTLLHKAIKRRDIKSCLFLLEHFADINAKGKDNMPPLQMAIHLHLEPVVDALCKRGVDVNSTDEKGHTSLWVALKSKQIDIANTLVKYNCDTTAWASGPNGCEWSLLHRAIVENDEDIACFLIRNKCDVNSHRRAGRNGEGGVEAWDGMTPLHLACASRQDRTVQCLLETDAKINVQDAEGRTPVHIAITCHNSIVTRLLLSHPEIDLTVKDRLGKSPFAVAMDHRDRESAAAILAREPSATEQFDNKGRNYLHLAIQNNDVDSVLFLISIEVNVNSFIQDSTHRSPLHLAVPSGDEVIVRHLLLAGVQVNAQDKNRQTPLHLAAVEDKASLISILLHNGADPDVPDLNLNNALHLAAQHGNLNAVRALLTESSINAEAYNSKGQNPLHVLASWSKDNAAAIFELFRQTMPEYPFDAPDAEENTALFLAYCNGAVGLCCSLLRAGAKLGTINKNGMSIFNAPVPTKKLLFRLLDLLNSEPGWSDGPNCHECGAKFNVTTRKHHCRHCGRLLCGKCSSKQMPILKYELTKPVRVCEVCFDFLTVAA